MDSFSIGLQVKVGRETSVSLLLRLLEEKTIKRIRSVVNSEESIDFEQPWTVGEFPVRSEIDRQQSDRGEVSAGSDLWDGFEI